MEIRDVQLRSIAQFEELSLGLGKGLHVLYGPNETGKSTLLQLLVDLLFGGTPAVRDWYDSQSRLTATIARGDSVYDLRRKRYRAQLVEIDEDDRPFAGDFSLNWLAMERDRYMQLFGFDHARLRTGGQSLLESDGDLGIALFETGSGLAHVKQWMERYRNHLGELFHPGMRANSTAKLNRALRDYQEARTAIRNRALRPQSWLAQEALVKGIESQVAASRDELAQLRKSLLKMERIRRNLPLFQQRHSILGQLAAFKDVPSLSPDEEASILEELAQAVRLRAEEALEAEALMRERAVLATMSVDEQVLGVAPDLELLRDGYGVYQSACEEVIRLDQSVQSLQREVTNIKCDVLPDHSIDEILTLRIPFAIRQRLEALARDYGEALADRKIIERDLRELESDQAVRRGALDRIGELPDIAALREQMNAWRTRGVSSLRVEALRDKWLGRRAELERRLGEQSLYNGSLDDVLHLPVPFQQTIQQYFARYQELFELKNAKERQLDQLKASLERERAELDKLEAAGSVPTEEDLITARRHRDRGWQLVKQVLHRPGQLTLEGAAYAKDWESLEEAYERAVDEADETVDRLRREADRVAKKAELTAQMATDLKLQQAVIEQMQAVQSRLSQCACEWAAEWAPTGIVPKSPSEMQAWTQQWLVPIRREIEELHVLQLEMEREQKAVDDVQTRLEQWRKLYGIVIPEHLVLLDDQLTFVDKQLVTFERATGERRTLVDALAEAKRKYASRQADQRTADAVLANLEDAYREMRKKYGHLPQDLPHVRSYLTAFEEFVLVYENWRQQCAQLEQKHQVIRDFEASVQSVAEKLTAHQADKQNLDPAQVVELYRSLQGRLTAAMAAKHAAEQQQRLVEAQAERLGNIRSAIAKTEVSLAAWRDRLATDDDALMRQVIERSRARRQAEERLADVEASILATGDGHSLAELMDEWQTVADVDSLPAQIAEIQERLEALEQALDEQQVRLGEQQQVFRQMDGSAGDVAEAAQQAALAAEEVSRYWDEVVRTQTNLALLEEALVRYRNQSQNGVLQLASERFSRMTLGRYQGIDLDDDPAAPRILALHRNGDRRTFSQLSDGTVDQLHFALRLAFLEVQARSGAPLLPLIMDDVLVHFDDERLRVTLEILDELANDVQILYFTHHQHMVHDVLPKLSATHVKTYELPQMIRYRQG
ncbi:AAA family ATPase [Alicyclobacillus fastidiosus]|uniref:AAA family ATPase n=1 Tax=Alicyclobacillus fastidiosus TaxID=392011 RepID=A0ABV5AE58_9BACL|nr:AAA family ATPase [Alicyclobacillus fastidiosus]WEH09882.1 AAA family ATPase [Alicyclobacillus fastidiosus]